MDASVIFKIMTAEQWQAAQIGSFHGAPVDLADGYIHFSTAAQVAETARRHFAAQPDLMLVAIDALVLGPALRWEASRGGDLFPHLYGPLPLAAVRWVKPLALAQDGTHTFPELEA
jgi:uncharacterized protein (DUF952 family)